VRLTFDLSDDGRAFDFQDPTGQVSTSVPADQLAAVLPAPVRDLVAEELHDRARKLQREAAKNTTRIQQLQAESDGNAQQAEQLEAVADALRAGEDLPAESGEAPA
jgi:hypothetical protein